MFKKKMKAIYVASLMLGVSGCVEFSCYSNLDHAKHQGNKFCAQGNGNKQLCESLAIADKNVCRLSIETPSNCVVSGYGIETFVRIPHYECAKLKEEACQSTQSCAWTFKNPVEMRFH